MTKVSIGPGVILPEEGWNQEKFDIGFRVLSCYRIQTDSIVTRFDVLIGGKIVKEGERITGAAKQLNITINSTEPGVSSLILPKGEILGGFVIQVSAKELVGALRALADAVKDECLS